MKWLNNGNTIKSEAQMNEFVNNVILSPEFSQEHLAGFDAHRENHRLDEALAKSSFLTQFKESKVDILVPSGAVGVPSQTFTVPGLLHRKLTTVISDAFNSSLSHLFHFSPFKLYHLSPITKKEERIFNEIYTSDAFLEEHEKVQRRSLLPPEDLECKREKVIAALMFSSDSTHLTNFGNAKAWPIYLMLGNLSKYIRAQPNSGAMHHLAYIPSLPDSFQDFASNFHCRWKSQKKQILSHCRRELMHGVWNTILDDDFLYACSYGIVIKCIDGVERRVYPRIFTYSADYPEKVLLACIRESGLFPCHRCLIPKGAIHQLGFPEDIAIRIQSIRAFLVDKVEKARNLIYRRAKPINGVDVEELLKETSSVPTTNAFVNRLGRAFNPSKMLVVDLLHEFEIGVWKSLFTHLIRLLYAAGKDSDRLVTELDKRFVYTTLPCCYLSNPSCRYRQISTFGSGTIRKFSQNSSEMKKLAARDFEDLLQVRLIIAAPP
ncbi:hypothetical protein HYPSUDRAFT_137895 [Hypholoma sublateritium FD-334 SS-4]|uniref:Uncharacterized protein n=1 Tax=Hypholoma sublateritium (strain FD-334 SS-4) TaxID=945553 RepID=A0A0D2PUH5_HYPSF|nr:hypothetical protein HYPSUDRAFT_137895 [Hypholoma sublateritium FD-334 SS-4]